MTRRRALRLGLTGLAGLLAVALVALVVLLVIVVRRPFPDQGGAVTLPGLTGTVTVLRDERGVPQLYADTAEDLFRAQGYVQAQDRFFEMDWRRHVTAGRLSELVGTNEDALEADKVVRTLGWRRVAEQELAQAQPATRRYLEAYARGVNDYLRTRSASQLGLDYTLLGAQLTLPRIEPWTPVDSLAWFKAMAWDLRGNYDDELARARIYGSVKDVTRVAQLWPPYPYDRHQPIVATPAVQGAVLPATEARSATSKAVAAAASRDGAAGRRLLEVLGSAQGQDAVQLARRAVESVPTGLGGGVDGVGSNSWVVSGALTASGKPLLANDPHLKPSLPGIWYQMGLHCRSVGAACPFDVAGFTFSGVPGVIIGHTDRISWGITNLGPDVTDFYLEQLQGNAAVIDGEAVPMTTRQEVIEVADAAPVTITVRSTLHGPLLSDVIPSVAAVGQRAPVPPGAPTRGGGYGVSLAWTALQPGHDMDAIIGVNQATGFAAFRAAALLMDAPAQNFVYADVDGHIGYQAPGRIPIRNPHPGAPLPADGTWPLPGWDSSFGWAGYVPTASLPWVEDPKQGYIVAANQAVTGPTGGVYFTSDFDYGYRSQRIRALLAADVAAKRKLGVSDMESIQADSANGIAPDLVPLLLASKVDAFTKDAQALLKGWNYSQPADDSAASAAAAYFNVVWAQLLDLTFADELPEGTLPNGGGRWYEVVRTLLKNPQDPWWDDRRTPDVVETRDEVIRKAMESARLRLTQILGKDPDRWQWGRLHRLRLVERPLGGLGATAPLHPLFDRGPLELPGGTSIVDAQAWDASTGTFDVTAAPSMRMVVDLSALDSSRWVTQTGASAHPGHPNYADQLDAWAHNRTFAWPFGEQAVKAAAVQTLELRPGAG